MWELEPNYEEDRKDRIWRELDTSGFTVGEWCYNQVLKIVVKASEHSLKPSFVPRQHNFAALKNV